MDIVMILIILVIVIVIGYVLSKPFLRTEEAQASPAAIRDDEAQYKKLIQEIKTLESEHNHEAFPLDAFEELEEKKKLAAKLSRQIHPSPEEKNTRTLNNANADHKGAQPGNQNAKNASNICSKCGHRIVPSDKFCTYCSHRLKS